VHDLKLAISGFDDGLTLARDYGVDHGSVCTKQAVGVLKASDPLPKPLNLAEFCL
jgi:hypothetical protein